MLTVSEIFDVRPLLLVQCRTTKKAVVLSFWSDSYKYSTVGQVS